MSTTSAEIPSTQRALLFNTSTSTLTLTPSHPIPSASPNKTLIRVHYTTITNGELTWAPFVNWPLLHIPCYDVCGTIVRLSSTLSVSTANSSSSSAKQPPLFRIGDKVYGRIDAAREGAAAEYAELADTEIAHVPAGLRGEDAATVPMSGLTAWQALFEKGRLSAAPLAPHSSSNDPGEIKSEGLAAVRKRVLILGAAGAVGQFGVQFAKLAGAHVVGTASSRNMLFLSGLGVDEVIDYTQRSVQEYVHGQEDRRFDVVFDCAGGASMLDAWNGIKRGGAYVSIVPGFKEPEGQEGIARELGLRYGGFFVMQSRAEELERIGELVQLGLVKTSPDSVFDLEEYERAFQRTATGHARGKVVLKVGRE